MGHVNTLIASRLKSREPSAKMEQMSKKSASGGLTSFSGLFQVSELSQTESIHLEEILHNYSKNSATFDKDLTILKALTSEIKAINHQAALLHGERIKKAHALLMSYKDGAFTAWLIATYGNRQTPYNLMQYYDFYNLLPANVKEKAELMPRQALYALASRDGNLKQKIEFVTDYKGETKSVLLIKIRDLFPLAEKDHRQSNIGEQAIKALERVSMLLKRKRSRLTQLQKDSLKELLSTLSSQII